MGQKILLKITCVVDVEGIKRQGFFAFWAKIWVLIPGEIVRGFLFLGYLCKGKWNFFFYEGLQITSQHLTVFYILGSG